MLRGAGRFADDFSMRGQVWARVVRSPVAHGRVRRVDTSEARSCPGVVGAVTAADLARFAVMAILVGAYFALWRDRAGSAARDEATGQPGQPGQRGLHGSEAS